jgi:hypothetical protein
MDDMLYILDTIVKERFNLINRAYVRNRAYICSLIRRKDAESIANIFADISGPEVDHAISNIDMLKWMVENREPLHESISYHIKKGKDHPDAIQVIRDILYEETFDKYYDETQEFIKIVNAIWDV